MAKATSNPQGSGPARSGANLDVSDQVYDRMVRLEHFFEQNWRPIAVVASMVLLVACIVVGVHEYHNRRSAKAASAWYDASQAGETDRRDAFRKVIEEYAGTGGGVQAAFDAAQLAVDEKDYDEAIRLYQGIIKRAGATGVGAAARVALGGAFEAQGDTTQAQAAYNAVLTDQPESYVVPQARLALGRMAEQAGRRDEAIEHYRAIVDTATSIVWIQAAQDRLNGLGASTPPAPAAPEITDAAAAPQQ